MNPYVPGRTPASRPVVVLSVLNLLAVTAFAPLAKAEPASAIDDALAKYYTVDRIRIDELPMEEVELSLDEINAPALQALGLPAPGLGIAPADGGFQKDALDDANVALDKIINMGQKIWKIVDANRPVVSVAMASANALPQGVHAWYELEGWQAPVRRAWRITYENLYGWDVVDFTYKVLFTPGGRVNGKGQYLTAVSVQPVDLDVAWGYTFNAKGSVPSVTNAGTKANPVAGAEVLLEWSIDTVVKHSQSSRTFYVRGDGAFQALD